MAQTAGPTGFVIIDKPSGMTSHDVVAKCRKRFGTRKVGHAGTLDPSATGVLLVGVGRATKLLTYLVGKDKTYEATIRFGSTTSTLDADGDTVHTFDMAGRLDPASVQAGADDLSGDQMQVPPMVSALKVDGVRLHQLAREGIEVERTPRPVRVERFEVRPTSDPLVFHATIDCSSGTYIRVLAADLGAALGGGAHLGALRRTRVGPFQISEAASIDGAALLAPLAALRGIPTVEVDTASASSLRNGGLLDAKELDLGGGVAVAAAVDGDGALVALIERHREVSFRPAVPFA